ncbi:RNA-directed DNA polymerase, eukaryota, reverse transcriptase zinc-binding domain protein [Tanacetum coccineum]
MNVRGEGIQEFVECVDKLEMEDINMCGMFYTWIQRMKNPALGILKKLDRIMGNSLFISMFPASFANFMPYLSLDHCPVVLCMPDVIVEKPRSFRFMNFLAEKNGFREVVKDNWSIDVQGYAMFKLVIRLKVMKKHLRRFNRQNGNVFEKGKFLQTELARVQECLDKDPSNSLLREEEMIYASAYREAAIDEERLLKQKTKIEWLKEGDSNSSYFHNVIKGRVTKSRIEVVYDGSGKAYYGDSVTDQFVSHFSNFLGTGDDVIDVDDSRTLFMRRLDIDTSVDLIKPITDEEIKEALFSIDDNKVSGPDGYTSKFFKAAWSVVDQDVYCAVKEFFVTGKILGELNATLISLIPKVSAPANVTDYRPISCCNIVYKTISKVITNRLKHVLSDLVDLNQSAFIPGRLISDNVLLAQEFMKGYNWDIRVRNCAYKVNIQKAYDTVNWMFLEFCLKEFGFYPGDPISPYLFTLVMEVLNLMIKRQIRNDKRDMVPTSILRRGLDEFIMSSGLYPSMSKSNAFFCNIPPDVKDEIKLVMSFNEGVLPIRYLGVPLVSKRVTKNDCRILIEVIQNKVNSWKNKFLSFAGRLQLIASVLSAMQVYWCSLFIFPLTVCDDIDSLMSNFLWSNKDGIGSMVSVKWSDVCRPKNQGGVGLKSMHEWNIALMAKHLWSIIRMSWSLNLRDKIKEFVNVKLGNGKTCSLWFDKWHPGGPLSKLIDHRMIYMAGLDINAKVIDLIDNNSWCWPIDWEGEYDFVLNVPRLVLGAAIYFIWQERNIRRMEHRDRSVDGLFKVVFENVRLKLMGLKLKWTSDVIKAFKIWNLPMKRDKDVTYNVSSLACFGIVMVYVAVQVWIICRSQDAHGLDWYLWIWYFISLSVSREFQMAHFQDSVVYGDGSGDSDWRQDSLMIQSMLVSFS